MLKQLRTFRIHVVTLAVVSAALAFPANGSSMRPDLSAQQTMAMVRAGQFVALNRYYSAVQAGYERRSVSDEKLRSIFRHFYDTSPDLAGRYAAWVEEMPRSYVAHLARAIYYVRVGEASRGNLIIADTTHAQLHGMDAAFSVASKELHESFRLDRKPLLSVFYALDIGKFEGDAEWSHKLLLLSLAMDSKNFIVRQMYEQTLMTAWGGSTDQIRAFVARSRRAGLSAAQMKDLESGVYSDQAWLDDRDTGNYQRAAAEYLEAARLSGDDSCLLCASAALTKAKDFPGAAQVLTQYLTRHPKSTEALALRAWVNVKLGRAADAVRDYKSAAELGDADSESRLGMMYAFGGLGLAQDRTTGIQWLRRAAAQGDPTAKQYLPVVLIEQSVNATPHH